MDNVKGYNEFIGEASKELWLSAIRKAKASGQTSLVKKFRNHMWKSEYLEKRRNSLWLRTRDYYDFDIYIDNYLEGESGSEKSVKKVGKFKINENTLWDHGEYSVQFYSINEEGENNDIEFLGLEEGGYALWRIIIRSGDNPIIFEPAENKFANKKSAKKFINLLRKLYIIEDPNTLGKIASSINNIELSKTEGGELFEFINKHWGSWDEFIEKINLRRIYDSY